MTTHHASSSAESFHDLHVVVTGGTGALGGAVVRRLLAAGAACHVPAFEDLDGAMASFDDLDEAARERLFVTPKIDLSDEGAVDSFYGDLGSLWASIHCAGGFAMGPVEESDAASWRKMMGRNAESAWFCCRAATRAIRRTSAPSDSETTGGRLVNVAARPALEPRQGAGMVPYTASKAAVAALTVALGEELAEEGIFVTAIAPSTLDTPANRESMPDADWATWPTPDEVARTLVHLASPANRTVRSAVVPVYGRT